MMGNLLIAFFSSAVASHTEKKKTFSFLSVGNITSITQFPVAIESLSVATKIDNGPAAAALRVSTQAQIKRPPRKQYERLGFRSEICFYVHAATPEETLHVVDGGNYYSSDQLAGDRQPSEDLELAVISSATDIETKENGDPSSELKSFSFFARFGRW